MAKNTKYRSTLIDGYITTTSHDIINVAEFIIKQLPSPVRSKYKFEECIKMVCTNLYRSCHTDTPLAVPMKRDYYKAMKVDGIETPHERWMNRRIMTRNIMSAIRDGLEAFEYITVTPGAYDHAEQCGRYSRWYPTERLRRLFIADLSSSVNYDIQIAPLVLLNKTSGKPDISPNTKGRYSMEYKLEQINTVHMGHNVSIQHPQTSTGTPHPPPLLGLYQQKPLIDNNLIGLKYVTKRIFCRGDKTLEKGGRFYTMPFMGVMHPQGLPSAWRKHIHINGEPTIELDYSALHINMLYAEQGVQYDGDPYGIVDRQMMKQMMLRAVNARNRRQAIESFNDEFANGAHYYDAIKQRHPTVALFKDSGIHLQYKDSCIMNDILMHFTAQGICAIPIHDSVIVQERYRDELHRVMDETYRNHMGGFSCPIK